MEELMVIFGFVIIISGMSMAFVYGLVVISARKKQDQKTGRAEAQSLQEFNRLLLDMERRIESLETLLVDHAGEKGRRPSLSEFE